MSGSARIWLALLSAMLGAGFAGGAEAGQLVGLTLPIDPGPATFDFRGPYIGGSLGMLLGGDSITSSAVIGYSFVPTDGLLVGAELAGRLYDNAPADDGYFVHARIGLLSANTAFYAFGGVGADTYLANLVWDYGAGFELPVTDHLAFSGELAATSSMFSSSTAFHAQLGARFHFSAFAPLRQPDSSADSANAFIASAGQRARAFGISEVRVGGALSNLELSPFRMPFEPNLLSLAHARPDSLQGDVLFDSPELLRWIGSPRPMIGGVLNLAGYESLIHAGLDWHWDLGDTPFYAELGAGLSLHNGYLNGAPAGYRNLGCSVLHEWQYGLGYNVNENVTVTAQWQHVSGLLFGCSPNDGVNNLGVAVGWKF